MSSLNIAIAGAGIGGLTAAIALHRAGHQVTVFEQSKAFLRVGADINLTPNAVRALDGLGIGAAVRIPPRGQRTASVGCGTAVRKPHAWKCPTLPNRSTGRRN